MFFCEICKKFSQNPSHSCFWLMKVEKLLESYNFFHGSSRKQHSICDVLRDLVRFVQFKTVKNTHGGVLLFVKLQAFLLKVTILLLVKKPAISLKLTLFHVCFSRFLNCTNGVKFRSFRRFKIYLLYIYIYIYIYIYLYANKQLKPFLVIIFF